MPAAPFALFITWTTYGTWLPGDPRGYVSNTITADGRFGPKRNALHTPFSQSDPATLAAARRQQKYDTVRLDAAQALIAAEALIEAAAHRQWQLIGAAIMDNHIHTLTTHCPDDGPAALRIFKGVAAARLSRAAGRPMRWWTQRGSTRYLHDQSAIDAVARYIHQQHAILCEIADMRIIRPPGMNPAAR